MSLLDFTANICVYFSIYLFTRQLTPSLHSPADPLTRQLTPSQRGPYAKESDTSLSTSHLADNPGTTVSTVDQLFSCIGGK